LKKLIIGLFCIFVVSALHAEVSDDVWKALINQNVIIEKNDGSEVAGKLASVADQVVVVIKADGKVVSVTKKDVNNVRVSTASETTAGEAPSKVADVPLRLMYFQFDPLGFLQIGPSAELGYRVTPSTLVVSKAEDFTLLANEPGSPVDGAQTARDFFSRLVVSSFCTGTGLLLGILAANDQERLPAVIIGGSIGLGTALTISLLSSSGHTASEVIGLHIVPALIGAAAAIIVVPVAIVAGLFYYFIWIPLAR
jgi:small nuclear ribonucleoprotein (snRNP)-like protein